jgi:hypothetical protein
MEKCFQLLAFGVIQFLNLLKAIKKYQKAGNKQTLKLPHIDRADGTLANTSQALA